MREATSLLFAKRDVIELSPSKTWVYMTLYFRILCFFFLEILLICICLKPMQNKALNDNVSRTVLALSSCLGVDRVI